MSEGAKGAIAHLNQSETLGSWELIRKIVRHLFGWFWGWACFAKNIPVGLPSVTFSAVTPRQFRAMELAEVDVVFVHVGEDGVSLYGQPQGIQARGFAMGYRAPPLVAGSGGPAFISDGLSQVARNIPSLLIGAPVFFNTWTTSACWQNHLLQFARKSSLRTCSKFWTKSPQMEIWCLGDDEMSPCVGLEQRPCVRATDSLVFRLTPKVLQADLLQVDNTAAPFAHAKGWRPETTSRASLFGSPTKAVLLSGSVQAFLEGLARYLALLRLQAGHLGEGVFLLLHQWTAKRGRTPYTIAVKDAASSLEKLGRLAIAGRRVEEAEEPGLQSTVLRLRGADLRSTHNCGANVTPL